MLLTLPSLEETVGVPQASVAVAVPSEALISPADGLQPKLLDVPPVIIEGGVISTVQLTVLEIVAVLVHASVAVNVLICDLLQPVLVTSPSLCVIVGVPHTSVAVAEPSAVASDAGLQPKFCVV